MDVGNLAARLDFDSLRLLIQVADAGSLSKAAVIRGTRQSVISRRISALERELGARLFERTGRGVALSEMGARALPRVRALLMEGDQLVTDARGTFAMPVGEVRIGLLTSLVHPLIGRVFRIARQRFPGIHLRVYEGSGGQLAEWIATGRVDIALLPRDGATPPPRQDALTLGKIALHLVGPPGDPLTRRPTCRFSQLDKLPLVLPGAPSGLRPILEQVARRKGISLNVVIEAETPTVQKEIVREGGAYTILAAHASYQEVRQGTLQSSRLVDPGLERRIVLMTTKQRPLTLADRATVELIRKNAPAAFERPQR